MSNTILGQILDYVNVLEEQGHDDAAIIYLDRKLTGCLTEDLRLVDESLLGLPVHLYSTKALLYLLTLTYYYRAGMKHRQEFFEKVYNELCFVRGLKEAEEALLVLQ